MNNSHFAQVCRDFRTLSSSDILWARFIPETIISSSTNKGATLKSLLRSTAAFYFERVLIVTNKIDRLAIAKEMLEDNTADDGKIAQMKQSVTRNMLQHSFPERNLKCFMDVMAKAPDVLGHKCAAKSAPTAESVPIERGNCAAHRPYHNMTREIGRHGGIVIALPEGSLWDQRSQPGPFDGGTVSDILVKELIT
ncbi:hypothetical protein Pelo_16897 [Pelomyxa schiedti]|nr:hypothetical protein Pelo_16897 [Pelomyxa schiedti]